ncbi:MAG: nucleotidyltransferase domain-containing protein [Methanomassiliicoccales archaeon]|nr:MAG: nucleotidyltransferase domain-containing protein [Methanomassiliicoccales archaeon]
MNATRILKDLLQKDDSVQTAYLFGSVAKGRSGPLSDIDIAVLLKESLTPRERYEKRILLINEISSALRTDDVNLVIMNGSPLLLNYNIIRDGKLLESKNESRRVLFETSIMSRYLDRKFYEDMHVREGMKRIAERGIL